MGQSALALRSKGRLMGGPPHPMRQPALTDLWEGVSLPMGPAEFVLLSEDRLMGGRPHPMGQPALTLLSKGRLMEGRSPP